MKTTPRLALAAALLPMLSLSALAAGTDYAQLGDAAASAATLGASMRALAQGPGKQAQAGAAAAAAAEARGVDLRAQLPDSADRNQGNVGSCHAFGSIAVLEAAYYRKNGLHLQLSEGDLFLRRTVLSGDVYSDFCASGKCELSEGNDPGGDISYVLAHGVLSGNSYQDFVKRYVAYRAAEQKTLQGLQKMRDEQGWLEKLLYDPRSHWKELQTDAQSKKLLSDYLEGRDRNSDVERSKVKEAFAGFTLKSKSFPFIGGADASNLTDAQCREKGEAQIEALTAELRGGRPVVVSMSLSGLPAWGQTDKSKHANHAFMIVGFADKDGKRVYQSRNSWGGDNPDVPAAQLCRVYGMSTVLAPGESSKF